MLEVLILLAVLAVVDVVALRIFLQDPYRDIKAPKRNDVEIPDLTFDARGMA
jgi:hypothetical protein